MDDMLFRNLGWGRRKNLRRHFGYPAKMHFGDGVPPSACTIVDMSESGAQLAVPAEAEVPQEFSLLVGGNANVRRQCRVMWRSGNRMGVEFQTGRARSPRGADQPLGARSVQRVRGQ
jgi:PilZ domain-containing protein